VGDVHGHRDVLVELLRQAGLVDAASRWSGADARVWLVGDLVDRGPDGIGSVDLVRGLERESGGALRCLLGNHEVQLVAVHRFGREETSIPGQTFRELWLLNGGVESDLRSLTPEHVEWITRLPPLARDGRWLVVHADTSAYLELGSSLEEVAAATAAVLSRGSAAAVDELLGIVSDRMRLTEPAAVDALLRAFGGEVIVHGHTPIASVRGVDPRDVREPLVSGGGRVMNVDHCLFAGGPGFVTRLESGSSRVARPAPAS
jgi:hypothetical protein